MNEQNPVGPLRQPPPALETGLDALANEISEEAKSMTPPGAAGGKASTLAATDRWGREFDPAIHVAKADGTPALYRGTTLVVKPGMKPPDAAPRRAAAPTQNRSFLAAPEADPQQQAPAPDAAPAPPPVAPASPERMAADSRLLTTLWKRLGQLFGGPEVTFQDSEAVNIHDTALLWRQEVGTPLPIGALGLHVVEGSMFLARVAATPEGRKSLQQLRALFGGPAPVMRAAAPAPEQKPDLRQDAPAPFTNRSDLAAALREA